MKKILFICDGENYSQSSFDFIKSIHKHEPVFIKGLFFTTVGSPELLALNYIPVPGPYVKFMEDEKRIEKKNIKRFTVECNAHNIPYEVLEEDCFGWEKEFFKKETRYADLMIISEELLCANADSDQPNTYMQELLRVSECPMVIVPENMMPIERIVIAYDGTEECIYALKQFCEFFPQYQHLATEFVYVRNEENDDIPDRKLLMEYIHAHFTNSDVFKLHCDAHKFFTTWLENDTNTLLIAGAYGRSVISNLFHSSFLKKVINDHQVPVFIAHSV